MIERISLAVENDVLRDRCKNNNRLAKQALAILDGNRYYSKEEIQSLRQLLNMVIHN